MTTSMQRCAILATVVLLGALMGCPDDGDGDDRDTTPADSADTTTTETTPDTTPEETVDDAADTSVDDTADTSVDDTTDTSVDDTEETEVVVTEPDWACLGGVTPLAPDSETVDIELILTDFVTLAGVDGVSVRVCAQADVSCREPVAELTSDDEGRVSFTLEVQPTGFAGYAELSREGYLDVVALPNVTVTTQPVTSTVRLPMVRESDLAIAEAALGAALDPARGHLFVATWDCGERPAAGAAVSVAQADDESVTWYLANGVPTADASATDEGGAGGVVNLPAGTATVTMTVGDDFAGSGIAPIRAGAITTLVMLPTPEPSGDWSCLSAVVGDPPETETLDISLRTRDFATGDALAGVTVKVCDSLDDCFTPVAELVTGDDGIATATVVVTPRGFVGWAELTHPDFVSTLVMANVPLTTAPPVSPLETPMVPSAALPAVITALGAELDPERGHLNVGTWDCAELGAGGVSLSVREADDGSAAFYISEGLPSSSAQATDDNGAGGFVNLPAGEVTVTTRVQGAFAGRGVAEIRPGWITSFIMLPTPERVLREVIEVSDIEGLMANIGRDDVSIELAPGTYVVPACDEGIDETADPTCGQMQQGDNSELWSHLDLAQDDQGVPLAGAEPLSEGAVIDCEALPPSGLTLSCLVAGHGSVIRNLTITNGDEIPARGSPGSPPAHRNAIMIGPDRSSVVEETRLLNARRGVVMTSATKGETRGTVRHSLIDGTELAGVFVWMVAPDFSGVASSRIRGVAHANRLTHIGLHPLLLEWGFFGSDNTSHARFTDNVIDDTNVRGVSAVAGASADAPSDGNRGSFVVRGGSISGDNGLFVETWTTDGSSENDGNCVKGEVDGVSFANASKAVEVFVAGWGTDNRFRVQISDSSFTGEAAGPISIADDEDNDFRFIGSAEGFAASNTNFDLSGLDDGTFAEDESLDQVCR